MIMDGDSEQVSKKCKLFYYQYHFGQWSRAHFSGNRYNIMTTGCVESINNALREARAYPIIALLDAV